MEVPSSCTNRDLVLHDNHTLYVSFDGLDREGVIKAFKDSFQSVKTYLASMSMALTTDNYHINYVTNKEGKSYNLAYIWVGDLKAYNVLAGLRPDGNPWSNDKVSFSSVNTSSSPITIQSPKASATPIASPNTSRWADEMDEEEERVVAEMKRYEPNPSIPKLSMARCNFYLPEDESDPDALYTRTTVEGISVEDIKGIFNRFCKGSFHVTKCNIKRGNAFIISFPQNSNRALFLQKVLHKYELVKRSKTYTLIFTLARTYDR